MRGMTSHGAYARVEPDIVRAEVTRHIVDFAGTREAGRLDLDAGPEAESIAPTDRANRDPVPGPRSGVPEQYRFAADGRDDDVEPAIVVEVGHCQTAADAQCLERRSRQGRDVAEPATADVLIEQILLRVAELRLEQRDVVDDVAVGDVMSRSHRCRNRTLRAVSGSAPLFRRRCIFNVVASVHVERVDSSEELVTKMSG